MQNETNQPEPQQTAADAPAEPFEFWTPARVRALVFTIVIMAVILVLGFGFIIYTVINRSLTAKDQPRAEIKRLIAPAPSLEIDLDGHQIRHLASDGATITLHVEKDGKAAIWLINANTRKIRKTITLKP